MDPAIEFMEYDRSDEFLESILNPSQESSDTVWQRNLKRRSDVPMDLDFMTAPVVDEFGHTEYDNTNGEHIRNSLVEYD